MLKIGKTKYRIVGDKGHLVEVEIDGKWVSCTRRVGDMSIEWRHQVNDEFQRRNIDKSAHMGAFKDAINGGHNQLAGWKLMSPKEFVNKCESGSGELRR